MLHPVRCSAQHLVHGSERRTYVHVGVTSPFLWAETEARVRHWPPGRQSNAVPHTLTEGKSGLVD